MSKKQHYTVLGASGYIGSAICDYLDHHQYNYTPLSRSDVDYTNSSDFTNYIHLNTFNYKKPTNNSIVINASGYIGKPNVDACEHAKEDCLIGNVITPQNIAHICNRSNITYVHISSGCIYNGYEREFTEEDASNFDIQNGSFYSGSKALAEKVVLGVNKHCYIFRLRIPFDTIPDDRNYLTKLLRYDRLLNKPNSISHRFEFVESCIKLIEQKAPYGIYNVTNPGSIDARTIVGMMQKFTPALVKDHEFSFFETEQEFNSHVIAPRSNCVLSTKKISKYVTMTPAHEIIKQSIIKYGENKYYCDGLFRDCDAVISR